jgi:DUF1680 family protein
MTPSHLAHCQLGYLRRPYRPAGGYALSGDLASDRMEHPGNLGYPAPQPDRSRVVAGHGPAALPLSTVAAALVATQEPDGYLGTYVSGQRFGLYDGADWDVWSHKYNLIGLLTYYRYTGNRDALAACRKVGDLLIATFPGRKSILGLGELYRVTGEPRLREALLRAWADITANRLYVTGTASVHERFGTAHELPNGEDAHLGETCVTTTWIQLNALLLAQTGEARFADEIERSLYNHLTAAQNPLGDDWYYYTALEGRKHYDKGITCCHSSGPRGLALAPTVAYLTVPDGIFVNTFETSQVWFAVGGRMVELRQQSRFPYARSSLLTVQTSAPVRFVLRIRVPAWAAPLSAGGAVAEGGWLVLPEREWKQGDSVALAFSLRGRVIPGDFTNYARVAYGWGPFILAVDQTVNPEAGNAGVCARFRRFVARAGAGRAAARVPGGGLQRLGCRIPSLETCALCRRGCQWRGVCSVASRRSGALSVWFRMLRDEPCTVSAKS